MKILVGIPCYRNTHVTKLSIDSVINQKDIDILLFRVGTFKSLKFSYHFGRDIRVFYVCEEF